MQLERKEVAPVKNILSHFCCRSCSQTSIPPSMTLMDLGSRYLGMFSARKEEHVGDSSEGFKTTAFPADIAAINGSSVNAAFKRIIGVSGNFSVSSTRKYYIYTAGLLIIPTLKADNFLLIIHDTPPQFLRQVYQNLFNTLLTISLQGPTNSSLVLLNSICRQ